MFERVHDQIKLNLIHAIVQCSLDTYLILPENIPSCATLQEACSIIGINYALDELNNILVANIETYFYCHSCRRTPDSLRSLTNRIFIFKLNLNNQIIAYPVVPDVANPNDDEQHCTYCNHSTKNMEMHIYKQVFVQCPSCLIVSAFITELLSLCRR